MILKFLKHKLYKKHINKFLAARKNTVNGHAIKTIGLLCNVSEFDDFEFFKVFFDDLNIKASQITAFTSDHKLVPKLNTISFFSPKDFAWNATLLQADVQNFITKEFDLLISYYKEDIAELNVITAASKANFKVGLSGKDERLHDLIIDVNPNEIDVFKNELKKYLKLLNKL